MNDEQRLEAVVNMIANASTLMMASMTGAMGEAMGGLAAGMGEAAGAALGSEDAPRKGEEMRQEVSQNVSSMVRAMVAETLGETRQQLEAAMGSLTPQQKKEVLEDIRHESYDRALEAVEKADFGLPRLTSKMSADDLAAYLGVQDPRFEEVVQKVLGVKQPRVFETLRGPEPPAEVEAPPPPPEPVPERITELPVTHLFPPGARTTLALRSKKPLWIRWKSELSSEDARRCEHHGIEVRQGEGSSTATLSGGTVVWPEKGEISVTMTNREAFPIAVAIRTEPYKED